VTVPTIAQLRNLADRAEHHGGLTPAEAARLRDGINHLGRPRNSPWIGWANKVRALRRKLHAIHTPIHRGGIQICGECSGWSGTYCLGPVTEWPCPTIDAFDRTFPAQETP